MSESYASFILGFAVVVLAIILILSFAKGSSHTATSSTHTQALPASQIKKTQEEIAASQKYTVQDGDTLWSIAQAKYGSGFDWKEIAKANSISDPVNLSTGTVLAIPQIQATPTPQVAVVPTQTPSPVLTVTPTPTQEPTTATAPSVRSEESSIAGSSYTVLHGDTLWDIAVRAYGDGYRWTDIAKANNLANPDLIFSGNVFTLPRP